MNKRNTVIYVAGPYRAKTAWKVKKNIDAAKDVALHLWKLGYTVICPHANTGFFDGELPDDVWLEGDVELLTRCDIVLAMRDWTESKGARKELAEAKAYGIPVAYNVHDIPLILTEKKHDNTL